MIEHLVWKEEGTDIAASGGLKPKANIARENKITGGGKEHYFLAGLTSHIRRCMLLYWL